MTKQCREEAVAQGHPFLQFIDENGPGIVNYNARAAATRQLEQSLGHALEALQTQQLIVHELEKELGIHPRWTEGSPEWREAVRLDRTREYRLAVDHLEGLVVARLAELDERGRANKGLPATILESSILNRVV